VGCTYSADIGDGETNMTKDFKNFTFAIIKHYNSPNEAVTMDGHKVTREEKVWVDEMNGFIRCAPDDLHFVYLDPAARNPKNIGRWFASCTCGSFAVLVGSNVYKDYGSPEGMMLICYHFLTFGKHADGSS